MGSGAPLHFRHAPEYPRHSRILAVSNNLVCSDGRTPEEEWQYRVDNCLSLRDTPPTEDERLQSIHRILEEDRELLQMLADA